MTMSKNEEAMLHKYISLSTHYLEFGSGNSTIHASTVKSLESIDSVESSLKFINEYARPHESIIESEKSKILNFHIIDIGETGMWGFPINHESQDLWPNYSNAVFKNNKEFDLVLVDGRFRVACVLNTLLNTPEYCTILVHDFWNRPEYHVILKFLHVKDKTGTLGVFYKKDNLDTSLIKNLIEDYQFRP